MKAALINDLSGLGRCSLVADIAVLSAMGVTACPMPTAVLSAQTAYPDCGAEGQRIRAAAHTANSQLRRNSRVWRRK